MSNVIANFNEAVLGYLEGELTKEKLVKKQEASNEAKNGIFLKNLAKSKKGDETAWAKLLHHFWDDHIMLRRLYYLSPWNNNHSFLVRLDYGPGFLQNFGKFPDGMGACDLDELERIIKERDWMLGDNDRYLIVMWPTAVRTAKAFWIGNPTAFKCRDGVLRNLKKPRRAKEWWGERKSQREKFFR